MELFIKTVFFYMIFVILCKGICIALLDYPRETPIHVDVIALLADIPILIWVSLLIW